MAREPNVLALCAQTDAGRIMNTRGYRPAHLILLALATQGCMATTWRSSTLPPREIIESQRPSAVQAWTLGGQRAQILEPVILGDSIASCRELEVAKGSRTCASYGPMVVALDDVVELQVGERHRDAGLTVVAVAGTITAVAILYALVVRSLPCILCGGGTIGM